MGEWIRLTTNDHVVIALRAFSAGESIALEDGSLLPIKGDVPKGHKILTKPVAEGQDVLKFGYSIGKAKESLEPGEWVHTHNLGTGLKGFLDYAYEPASPVIQEGKPLRQTFQGYVRDNGEVGIRNEIWILNTVGCINKTCEIIANRANAEHRGRVDGVYHFSHPFGCSQLGDDLKHTQKLLASLANHPNAAGVLVVGLGC
jgi:altronate hydrolase